MCIAVQPCVVYVCVSMCIYVVLYECTSRDALQRRCHEIKEVKPTKVSACVLREH